MNRRSYMAELQEITFSFPEEKRRQFMSVFLEREKNPVVSYGLNAWLGFFGAELFYVGKPLLGVLKLITFGGGGIWTLINYFIIGDMTRAANIEAAREVKLSMQ